MALTTEWRSRIEQWRTTLEKLCYRKLADVPLSGFVTTEQLRPREALQRPFRPMPVGTPWGAKWEYAWFRAAVTAPKEAKNLIVTAGTQETPYYTNSTHLPVSYSDDLFEVLEHQDELQTLYTGGTVLHIFLGEQLSDWRQARRLVRTVAENFHLPYYTFSVCPVHGYIPGEHPTCPYPHTPEELARWGRRRS